MGTTDKGIPYIDPTQPIADTADAMKDLAEAVDELLGIHTPVGAVTATLSGDPDDPDVTFYLNGVEL